MENALEKAVSVIIEIAQPEKIILFGSRAKTEDNENSDYDLLILKKGIAGKRKLAQKIYLNFCNIGAPIDLIVEDSDNYESKKNDPFLIFSEINKSGKVIYERS